MSMVVEPSPAIVTPSGRPGSGKVRRIHLGVLALAAVLMQLALHHVYLPWWCGDSPGYAGPASVLYESHFTNYLGLRPPGYPVFLLGCELLSGDPVDSGAEAKLSPRQGQVIAWAQSALAVASVVLLYLSMERLQIRAAINFGVTLLFALLVGVEQFALLILSETLCVFLIVLAVYLTAWSVDRWRRGKAVYALMLLGGFTFGAAILVRPNILLLWLVLVAAVPALAGRRMLRRRSHGLGGVFGQMTRPLLAGGALIPLIWLFINYEIEGVLTLSQVIDLTRACAAYNLFDQVHPHDRLLGDIMVKYYHRSNWPGHEDRTYIWQALQEIGEHAYEMPVPIAPGHEALQRYELFRYIGAVSNELLWEHPRVWAENSLTGMEGTFDFHFDRTAPGQLHDPVSLAKTPVIVSVRGWKILCRVMDAEIWPLTLLYALTFVALPVAIGEIVAAPAVRDCLVPLTVAALSLGAISCMATLCIFSAYDNRYSVPFISLYAICSAYVLERGASAIEAYRVSHRSAEASPPRPGMTSRTAA